MASSQDPGREGRKSRGYYTKWTPQDDVRLLKADNEYQLRLGDKILSRRDRLPIYLEVMSSVLEAIGKTDKTMEQIERRVKDVRAKQAKAAAASSAAGGGAVGQGAAAVSGPSQKARGEWTPAPPPPRTEEETMLLVAAIQAEATTDGRLQGRSKRRPGVTRFLDALLTDPAEKAVLDDLLDHTHAACLFQLKQLYHLCRVDAIGTSMRAAKAQAKLFNDKRFTINNEFPQKARTEQRAFHARFVLAATEPPLFDGQSGATSFLMQLAFQVYNLWFKNACNSLLIVPPFDPSFKLDHQVRNK